MTLRTTVLYRQRAMDDDEGISDDGEIRMLSSTDAAVDFGGYREVLMHGDGCIDHSTARSLLINHDPDQLCGGISSITSDGKSLSNQAKVDPEARMSSNVSVQKSVKNGSLRGVSIGYSYDREDASYDETSRTLTVRKWRLHEISLTPTPRDGAAQVQRSLDPTFISTPSAKPATSRTHTMDPIRLATLMASNPDLAVALAQRSAGGAKEEEILAFITAERGRVASEKIETERSKELIRLRMRDQITAVAESHGLRATPYLECADIPVALTAMAKDKAEIEAKRSAGFRPAGVEGVTVIRDGGDKFRDAAIDNFMCLTNVPVKNDGKRSVKTYNQVEKDQGARQFGPLEIARRCAEFHGIPGARDWNKAEAAHYAMENSRMGWVNKRASANQTSSMFTQILANVLDKTVMMGFQGFEAVTYEQWTRRRIVQDFKQFNTAALVLGNLVKTAENATFPEIQAKDAGYNAALNMWGATLTLTLQALISDDLGEFFSKLGQAGMIAKRTVDREVYNQLMSATWTNDTTSGATLANSGSLDLVRTAFREKKSPTGLYLGNAPVFLLHPLELSLAAERATGRAQPPGEQAYIASNEARQIVPIEAIHLDDTTLNAAASTSSYYLIGDATVDTMVVAFLNGMEQPQVMEFDAGAVAARNFKLMLPFVATPATYTDNLNNTRLLGMQQGTV